MRPFSSESPDPRRVSAREAALFFFAVLPLILLGGTLLQAWNMKTGTILTEWGLILMPVLLYLGLRGKRIPAVLMLRKPSGRHLAGSILLALSAVPIVAEISVIQDSVVPIPEELAEAMKNAFTVAEGESVLLAYFAFSLTPAVCEEALFRGFLLGGLSRKFGKWGSVVVTGLLFGAFHLNAYRFIPTAVIGLLLGYIVLSSSSIVTGILYHAINNAFALSVLNFRFLNRYPWLMEESHIPVPVLAASMVLFVYSTLLFSDGWKGGAAGTHGEPREEIVNGNV